MKSVYCDESGFTGNDLWHADQPHFVYAAVSVDEDEARSIVERTRRDYSIRTQELHSAQLKRRESGKRAMLSVLESLAGRSSVAVFHKRYSLAGKMFEYLIEPAISDQSSMFYDIGLHKFVANGLYLALLAEPSTTKQTFIEFQDMMRSGDSAKLDLLAKTTDHDAMAGFLRQIGTFITCNRQALQDEIAASEACKDLPRWLLELTMTALRSLLTSFSGQEMHPLSVTCDESKPLLSQAEVFDAFVGRTDYLDVTFDGRTNPLTFNLAQGIKFASSKEYAGLQLADIVAGAAAFSLKNPADDFAVAWLGASAGMMHRNSVLPDLDEIDLTKERAIVNAMVLQELVDRSVRAQSLFNSMPRFIEVAREYAPRILSDADQGVIE